MHKHRYTDSEKRFMKEYVQGHSYTEIQKEFTRKFGWEITMGQVKSYINNHHLNTGKTGYFEKGAVPANKGKRMPMEVYKKAAPTMFKKGNIPKNHRPVGSERVTKDGYIEIKVAEPNKREPKHKKIWRDHYGNLPKGHVLIFLDENKMNTDISNLKPVTRSELLIMNRYNIHGGGNTETMEVAVNLAKLINTTNKMRRRNNEQ